MLPQASAQLIRQKNIHMNTFKLNEFLPYKLSILSQTISQLIGQAYGARFNLTMSQWRCLVIIAAHSHVTAKIICTHTLLDKMTVSRAIRALKICELIKLSPSPDDKRKQLIVLSESGQKIYDEVLPIALGYEKSLLNALTPEENNALDSIIAKLINAAKNLPHTK